MSLKPKTMTKTDKRKAEIAKRFPVKERGRPTLYTPEMCDRVREVMGTGLSLTAFAGSVGVSRDVITDWQNAHPEFLAACKAGQALRTQYLERTMLDNGIAGPQVTARIFALKNAAPDEWRDRQDIKHSGAVGQYLVEVPPESDDWNKGI